MRDGTARLAAHMTQKMTMKILNEYLEINMPILDDNTKMEFKETSFAFRRNFLLQNWTEQDI